MIIMWITISIYFDFSHVSGDSFFLGNITERLIHIQSWSRDTQDGELDIAYCPNRQAANITPPSTHRNLLDGMLQTVRAPDTSPRIGNWASRRRAGLNHLSQCLWRWLPAQDNQVSGPGDKPFSSLQNLRSTSQDMRSEKHCTSPSLLRMTHQSESVGQPRKRTTSIESPKVKNPDPMLHLIQHHLTLLQASSQGNDRISSSDLFDSGGWVPRSLQVHHWWCTVGQQDAHPWDHNDGPRGHFHKSCNQQPTNHSSQMSKPTIPLAPRLNRRNHQRALHTTFDNQYGHRKTNTKYWNTN